MPSRLNSILMWTGMVGLLALTGAAPRSAGNAFDGPSLRARQRAAPGQIGAPVVETSLVRLPRALRPLVLQELQNTAGEQFHARPVRAARAVQDPGGMDRDHEVAFRATNEPHGFDVAFTDVAVRLEPRSQEGHRGELALRLVGLDPAAESAPVTHGPWRAGGPRVERELTLGTWPLTEWYVNGPLGLEQGFTLSAPPPGDGPILLQLAVSDAWVATLIEPEARIELHGLETDLRLRYGHLFAYDATGRHLPARLTTTAGGIGLWVDPAGAMYPVTIDPLIEQQKLTASDGGTGDQFGFSVAMSDTTAVIGAPGDDIGENAGQGSAYVFVRSGGVWSLEQKLTAADGLASDAFGSAVDLSGDTTIIGAPGDDVGGNADQGSAYIYTRSGNLWTLQQKLTASDGAAGDAFAARVAASTDTALVGARLDDIGGSADQGSAYVFTRSGGAWVEHQPKLTASDGAAGDLFGASLTLEGDDAILGAPRADIGGNANQGAAYAFRRLGGAFVQQQKLTASDGAAEDFFGASVAVSGSTALVGADADDIGGTVNQGSAYVFLRNGGAWAEQAPKLTASDGAADDRFGSAVALAGDLALLGAPEDDVDANAGQGSVYVFTRVGGGFVQQQRLAALDGAAGDGFGLSVAATESRGLVGALSDDIGASLDQGSAYVYLDTAPAPPGIPAPPTGLTASVAGTSVTLSWNASAGATSYRLRVGSTSGASNLFDGNLGNVTGLTAVASAGTYFVRVHAVGPGGESGPSTEVRVDVSGCALPPAPTGLVAVVAGSTVTLSWTAAATSTSYVIEAGSAPGGANLANFDTGNAAPFFTTSGVPPGLYFVRVRSRNACGIGGASNEIAIIIGGSLAPGTRFP